MKSIKIAIYGKPDWALGSIHSQLGKSLRRHYDVYFKDWTDPNQTEELKHGKFDVVIAEANIMIASGYLPKYRVIPMFHHPVVSIKDHGHFDFDYSDVIDKFPYIYAISDKVADEVVDRYNKACQVLPIGVSPEVFSPRKLRPINNLGHVRGPAGDERYYKIKGLDMFNEICEKTSLPEQVVFGKKHFLGTSIYSEADMVVCTSEFEGHPMPMLECAAAKIPFISTPVGIVTQFDSIKTFTTSDEAKEIIDDLRSSPEKLQRYVDEVHEEVMSKRSIDLVVDQYWVPKIEEITKKKISILLPTRNRPDFLKEMIDSCIDTANDISSIEFVLYTDDDDNSNDDVIRNYQEFVSIKRISGPRIVLSEMWNACYEKASADIFMHCGDDIRFRTQDWDKVVLDKFDEYPDKIAFVFGTDGVWDPGSFGTHGFIHRNWAEAVGYFVPPYFSSCFNDTWLNEVSKMIGRHVYVDVYTEHLHPWINKHEWDQTHMERLEAHSRDDCDSIWDDKANEREADAKKLQAVINQYNEE